MTSFETMALASQGSDGPTAGFLDGSRSARLDPARGSSSPAPRSSFPSWPAQRPQLSRWKAYSPPPSARPRVAVATLGPRRSPASRSRDSDVHTASRKPVLARGHAERDAGRARPTVGRPVCTAHERTVERDKDDGWTISWIFLKGGRANPHRGTRAAHAAANMGDTPQRKIREDDLLFWTQKMLGLDVLPGDGGLMNKPPLQTPKTPPPTSSCSSIEVHAGSRSFCFACPVDLGARCHDYLNPKPKHYDA